MSGRNDYQCSFCGKAQAQVKRLIAGPDRVFICDECVTLCGQIIAEDSPVHHKDPKSLLTKGLSPKYIYQRLAEYVVGQEQAKKVLSVAVYNHYKRVWSNHKSDDVEIQKSNILMVGPSGSGKTYLAQTLARILDVPFAISDATSLTEAGYVGEDVENILLRLIQAADYDIARAEQGIVYIDEIDKIARKEGRNPSITRDVSGEGVQQGLLKIIEGCVANVPPQGGRKHPHQEFLQIRTDNILFMCGGAFDGLDKMIEKRVFKDRKTIGFKPGSPLDSYNDSDPHGPPYVNENILQYLAPDDLLEFGLIPELIGRLPIMVSLNSLDKQALLKVLTEPKNSFVKQYQSLFKMDNVDLSFTDAALEAAAVQALKQKTGARGLRTILERTLLDVMYELPSMSGVKRCIVDADAILGSAPVTLLNASGEKISVSAWEKKSA